MPPRTFGGYVVAGLSNDKLRAFGEALSKLRPPPPPGAGRDAAGYSRGRALAQKERCGTCHEPDYSGRENMPRLANQREDYLLKALRDYKTGVRVGYGTAVMPELVAQLGERDLEDLAHFLHHFRR